MFIVVFLCFKLIYLQDHKCHGREWDSPQACNAAGECVAEDICECNTTRLVGTFCEQQKHIGDWELVSDTLPKNEKRYNHDGVYVESHGLFVIYGGYSKTEKMAFNDAFGFDIQLKKWRLLSGNHLPNTYPVYPPQLKTKNLPFNQSNPGSRYNHRMVSIENTGTGGAIEGSFILMTFGRTVNETNMMSDIWEYNLEKASWAHVHGPKIPNTIGIGYYAEFDTRNSIGARRDHGLLQMGEMFYIFGGDGFDNVGTEGLLNDLWCLSKNYVAKWCGIEAMRSADNLGEYEDKGMYSALSLPGGRRNFALFKHTDTEFGIFGGDGCDYDECSKTHHLGDMWLYNTETRLWKWTTGSKTNHDLADLPHSPSQWKKFSPYWSPGGRRNFFSGKIDEDNFLLFGGQGQTELSTKDLFNDVWVYNFPHQSWKFMGGTYYGEEFFFGRETWPLRRMSGVGVVQARDVFMVHGGRELEYLHVDKKQKYYTGGDLWIYKFPPMECFGVAFDDDEKKVCGGHGTCFQEDTCACQSGWGEQSCHKKVVMGIGSSAVFAFVGVMSGLAILLMLLVSVAIVYYFIKGTKNKETATAGAVVISDELDAIPQDIEAEEKEEEKEEEEEGEKEEDGSDESEEGEGEDDAKE